MSREVKETWTLKAAVGQYPIVSESELPVDPSVLPLSERLLTAIADWQGFYDEIAGDLSDDQVAEEFLSQGYKIAHAMRRELKGRQIYFCQPLTGERLKVS